MIDGWQFDSAKCNRTAVAYALLACSISCSKSW